jgi:porphobilinogen synthase
MNQWIRPRRLRTTARMRELAVETRVDAQDLIQGYFVLPGEGRSEPIAGLPGIERQSVDMLLAGIEKDFDLGIRNVLLFGVPEPELRDPVGSAAYEGEPLVARAVRALKKMFGVDLLVVTDVCLCAYTSHGHCGQLDEHGGVDNDETLPLLAKMALCHAEAGADIVAPSDMMDGRVAVIREALDEAGYSGTAILSYAAKFASAFYGPFREAAGSAPGHGDRKGYQADPRSGRAAVRDALLDEAEGADMLMVKPALAYLDIIAELRASTLLPLVCYNVSGEYAMLKVAAREGLLDLRTSVLEVFTAMRRAGADRIITYHAREALAEGWLG